MENLTANKRTFEEKVPWARKLLEYLTKSNCSVSYVRQSGDYVWLLRVKVPNTLSEGFGTAPEVLAVAIHGDPFAKDIELARKELYRSNFRLDLDLLLVAAETGDLEKKLAALPGKWGQWIPISVSDDTPLIDLFKKHLPAHDVFDERNPVRGRQVLGRQVETRELVTRIESAECVGVYGFRKVGKTSVVRAATDTLDPVSALLSFSLNYDQSPNAPRTTVIWTDMQRRLTRRTLDSVVSVLVRAANVTRRGC